MAAPSGAAAAKAPLAMRSRWAASSASAGAEAEPALQYLGGVAAERRRAFQPNRLAVDPHRPGGHLVLAIVVLDVLHEAALLEIRLVLQFQRVEHRAGRHADRDQLFHRVALVVFRGPFA